MKNRRRDDAGVSQEPHLGGPRQDHGEKDPPEERPDEAADGAFLGDEPALQWTRDSLDPSLSYGQYVQARLRQSSALAQWLTAAGCALVAGPAAIVVTFFEFLAMGRAPVVDLTGIFMVSVLGPVVEEVAKIICVLWLVERRPWLLPGRWAIPAVGLVGGLSFGAIENLLYTHVYTPDAGEALAAYRWAVTFPAHGLWSLIAAFGVVRMWRQVFDHGRPADVSAAFPWIAAAIILHALYNTGALAFDFIAR
ncbi:MAG: PrsW family glutamic-type intramembrane protease [Candidatus Hydrogenedentota bacterium]